MRRASLLLTAGLLAASCSHAARNRAPETAPAAASASVASIPELKPQPGETVTAYDPGHAGRPTLWKYSVVVAEGKERVVRRERDLNGDGREDVIFASETTRKGQIRHLHAAVGQHLGVLVGAGMERERWHAPVFHHVPRAHAGTAARTIDGK